MPTDLLHERQYMLSHHMHKAQKYLSAQTNQLEHLQMRNEQQEQQELNLLLDQFHDLSKIDK
jgi:hypothetical protein